MKAMGIHVMFRAWRWIKPSDFFGGIPEEQHLRLLYFIIVHDLDLGGCFTLGKPAPCNFDHRENS